MITEKQVEHLAKLARLDITEQEKRKYAEQISSILIYFKQLAEVDTTNVQATDHVTGLLNVMRPDEPKNIFSARQVMNAAPEVKDKQIKVPAVFENKK